MSDQQYTLTSGIITRLLRASEEEAEELYLSGPTCQFLSVKLANSASKTADDGKNDRYRIILSDGEKFTQSMLTTQLNYLVYDQKIGRNTVAIIDKMIINIVQGKRHVCLSAFIVHRRVS